MSGANPYIYYNYALMLETVACRSAVCGFSFMLRIKCT